MRGRKPTPPSLQMAAGNPGKRGMPAAMPQPDIEHLPVPGHFAQLGTVGERAGEIWQGLMPELVRWGLVSRMDTHTLEIFVLAVARKEDADRQVATIGVLTRTPNGYPMHNPFLAISNKQAEIIKSIASEFGLTPAGRVRLAGTAQPELPFDDLDAYEAGP